MTFQDQRFAGIAGAVALLLLIPFIAMQFTEEVSWSSFDFLLMGSLLLVTGIGVELVLRKLRNIEHRLTVCGALLLVLLIIWAELSVGIFGSVFAGS